MSGVFLLCALLSFFPASMDGGAAGPHIFSDPDSIGAMFGNQMHGGNENPFLRSSSVSGALLEEFMIDTSMVYFGAGGNQDAPCAASDGRNWFVVWSDTRGFGMDIYGTRVDSAGSVLDPFGIPICTVGGDQKYPSISFNGNVYFVTWMDCRVGLHADIFGTRIDTSGQVLDPMGIALSKSADDDRNPSVACGGSGFLVVWHYSPDGKVTGIHGARVDRLGNVLDTSAIVICTTSTWKWDPCIAFDGGSYMVVWGESRKATPSKVTCCARLDTLGNLLTPKPNVIWQSNGAQLSPSIAFDGVNYLLVWGDTLSSDIYGTRVNKFGGALDPSGIAISTASQYQSCPFVTFDGTDYFVVWVDSRNGIDSDIFGARVSVSGTVLDTAGVDICGQPFSQSEPLMSPGGSSCLVVCSDKHGGYDWNIVGRRIRESGSAIDSTAFLITYSAQRQTDPSMAFDGTNYLVVWCDNHNGEDLDIYGARISPSGILQNPPGAIISGVPGCQAYPSVAFDGINYLLVWENSECGSWFTDVMGARMDKSGNLLDTFTVARNTSVRTHRRPSASFGGGEYLVAWETHYSGYDTSSIYCARVDTCGVVLDPGGIAVSTGGWIRRHLSLASCGSTFLVTWSDFRSLSGYDVYGARVSGLGAVFDPDGIPVCTLDGSQGYPSVASDGKKYLVVWEDGRDLSKAYDIYGARVDTSGSVLDTSGIRISTELSSDQDACAAFDGTDYFVAWKAGLAIRGARLDTAGTVLDSAAIDLAGELTRSGGPKVLCGPGGKPFVTRHGFRPEPYDASRVFAAFYPEVGIPQESSKFNVQGSRVELTQNKPNPFHLKTTIRYSVDRPCHVALKVYDSSGRLVNTLVNEQKPAGTHSVTWNGTCSDGSKLASGVYFCKLQAGKQTATQKMIWLE
jgi:hypothetical protein